MMAGRGGGGGSILMIDQLEEEPPVEEHPGPGHQNYGLHDQGGITAVVSPYRMNPTYRRPRPAPGTDSDHGYSTMTGGQGDLDSEIMSCLGEGTATGGVSQGLQGRRDRFRTRAPLSLQSVTSGVSSRTSSPFEVSQVDKTEVTLTENNHEEEEKEVCPARGEIAGEMTVLNKHQIVVAATVHMVDTQ